MKKILHLLFTLSIISPQLWAAEPGASAPRAAAAPDEVVELGAAAIASLSQTSPATPIVSAENADLNRILALLKLLASHDDFKLINPEDPEEVRNKTNCTDVANKVINKIFGIDMRKETKKIVEALKNGTYLPHLDPDIFRGQIENLVNHKIGHELFDDSVKKEYKLFYISKNALLPGKFHAFLVFKIGSSVQTNYIILQSWNNVSTLPKWIGIDSPPFLPSWDKLTSKDDHLEFYTEFNPSNKLVACDVRRYMDILFSTEKLDIPPQYFVKIFDHPNLLDLISKVALSPSRTPAAASAASAASPSPVDRSKTCSHSDCTNPGTRRCSRCKIKKYCSEDCQKKDWPMHKLSCVPAPAKKS